MEIGGLVNGDRHGRMHKDTKGCPSAVLFGSLEMFKLRLATMLWGSWRATWRGHCCTTELTSEAPASSQPQPQTEIRWVSPQILLTTCLRVNTAEKSSCSHQALLKLLIFEPNNSDCAKLLCLGVGFFNVKINRPNNGQDPRYWNHFLAQNKHSDGNRTCLSASHGFS